jgi:predicted MPP superfamily phosphohydrolase
VATNGGKMRREATLALAAWLALTTIGTTIHHILWNGEWTGGFGPDRTPIFQSLGNCVHVLVGPGWVALRFISRDWPTGSILGPLLANAIGWAFWVFVLGIGLRLRRWLLAPRTCQAQESPEPAPAPPVSVSRRRFLVDGPCAVMAVGGAGVLGRGEFVDPWSLRTSSYTVPIRGLPRTLDGLRLAQLSDTHLGPRIPASFIRASVQAALDLDPDLFILTGDYIHNGRTFIQPSARLFAPLVATGKPVLGVLGNHDWYGDGPAMTRELGAVGVLMLDNSRTYLSGHRRQLSRDLPSDDALCIAGLGDLLTDWVDPVRALRGVPEGMPRLVLTHNPDTAEVVTGRMSWRPRNQWSRGFLPYGGDGPRIDLMICGHTHGGQIRLPFIGTPLIPCATGQKYAAGLVEGPGFPVVISRGIGMSILPIRWGVPPEVVLITLRRA